MKNLWIYHNTIITLTYGNEQSPLQCHSPPTENSGSDTETSAPNKTLARYKQQRETFAYISRMITVH